MGVLLVLMVAVVLAVALTGTAPVRTGRRRRLPLPLIVLALVGAVVLVVSLEMLIWALATALVVGGLLYLGWRWSTGRPLPAVSMPNVRMPGLRRSPAPLPTTLEGQIAQLPRPQRDEAASLLRAAREAERALDEHSEPDQTYTVRATLSDYLPESVGAYLDVPPAERHARLANGRTATETLDAQLRLIRTGLNRASAAQREQKAGRLLTQSKFLEERFKDPDFQV